MECRGPGTAPAGHLLFRGSNGKATGKYGLRVSLVQTTQRRGARAFLRGRQGSEFLARVCTKNPRLLAPDMQLKHVSWTLDGIPMIPHLLLREFPGTDEEVNTLCPVGFAPPLTALSTEG